MSSIIVEEVNEYSNVFQSPQISLLIITLVVLTLFLIYRIKLSKYTDPLTIPTGYVFCVQLYVEYIRNLVVGMLGKKSEKLTPFFIYLFTFIFISNCISVFGFVSPTSFVTVTVTLATMSFIGTIVNGIVYQKISYLKNFTFNLKVKNKSIPVMIQPLNIISRVTPLISLSMRLWGNMFAGTLIISLLLGGFHELLINVPVFSSINLIGCFAILPLDLYFGIISSLIQTIVFVFLTLIYWKMERKIE